MSRLVRYPIKVPDNVKYTLQDNIISFTGPMGVESYQVPDICSLEIINNNIKVIMKEKNNMMSGTIRQLIQNACTGVSEGFSVKLTLKGVGYKVNIEKDNIIKLDLGYSHSILYQVPDNIKISLEKNNIIILKCSNKQLLGQIAEKIRSKRVPEPYKGAGIHIEGKIFVVKQRKK